MEKERHGANGLPDRGRCLSGFGAVVALICLVIADVWLLCGVLPGWWLQRAETHSRHEHNLVEVRRALYDPEKDPRLGEEAPALTLWRSRSSPDLSVKVGASSLA